MTFPAALGVFAASSVTPYASAPTRKVAVAVLLAAGLVVLPATGRAAPADTPAQVEAAAEAQSRAQTAENDKTRGELNKQRTAVEHTYDAKVKECHTRFAVTGCLEDARAWRIEALRPITAQEKQVNARERLQRAAEQRARVEAKNREAAEEASRHSTDAVKAGSKPPPDTSLPPSRTPRANPALHQRQLERETAQAEQKAAQRRQAAAERQKQIEEERRKAKEDQAKRAAKPVDPKKPPPVHLPTPSASDIKALGR